MIRNTTINTSVSTGCVAMQDPLHEQGIWWVELHRMVVTHKSPVWTLMLQPAGAWAPCWSDRSENGSLFLDSCSHNNEAGDQPRRNERQSSPRQCHFSLLRNGRGSDVATLPPRTWARTWMTSCTVATSLPVFLPHHGRTRDRGTGRLCGKLSC